MLARCGLRLDAPFTVQDLLKSWNREAFERGDFDLVLVGLGMTEEQAPWRNHSSNVWHFDSECIEGDGCYTRIAERMKDLAEGALPIENIRDHVDLDTGSAWLTLDYQGEQVRFDLRVNDDWVDPAVFSHFVELLGKSEPSKMYVYYDLQGQDCIIACVQATQFRDLKKAGIRFQHLT
jgi:hypothetical protein